MTDTWEEAVSAVFDALYRGMREQRYADLHSEQLRSLAPSLGYRSDDDLWTLRRIIDDLAEDGLLRVEHPAMGPLSIDVRATSKGVRRFENK